MRKGSGSSMPSMPSMPSFGVGATAMNVCSADNDSFFCKLSRIFQMIMWVIVLCMILYFIYVFVWPFVSQKMKGSKLSKRSK